VIEVKRPYRADPLFAGEPGAIVGSTESLPTTLGVGILTLCLASRLSGNAQSPLQLFHTDGVGHLPPSVSSVSF